VLKIERNDALRLDVEEDPHTYTRAEIHDMLLVWDAGCVSFALSLLSFFFLSHLSLLSFFLSFSSLSSLFLFSWIYVLQMVQAGNAAAGGLIKCVAAVAVMGFVRFVQGYYILLVTKSKVSR
jgi:hypothetical protein